MKNYKAMYESLLKTLSKQKKEDYDALENRITEEEEKYKQSRTVFLQGLFINTTIKGAYAKYFMQFPNNNSSILVKGYGNDYNYSLAA